MTDFTDFTETEIRDWLSQGVDVVAAPATIYVALHTSDPGDSPDGSTEVGAGDYSRVGVTAGSGWDTPTTSSFENASVVDFGTATSDWGTITHVSLWDASTGGNCLAAGNLDGNQTITTDDQARFPAGDLDFSTD